MVVATGLEPVTVSQSISDTPVANQVKSRQFTTYQPSSQEVAVISDQAHATIGDRITSEQDHSYLPTCVQQNFSEIFAEHPELAEVVGRWRSLSPEIRSAILVLVKTVLEK